MLVHKIQLIVVFSLILIVSFNCTKQDEQQKAIEEEKVEYSIPGNMEGQVQRIKINYDSLLTVVDQLTEMLAENPFDISLRKKLVATCYDSTFHVLVASGRGKPITNARTPTQARESARRAAKVDAYRWAVYLNKWRLDPTTPDFGKISAELPGGLIVSENVLPDSSVQVLVEVKLAPLP